MPSRDEVSNAVDDTSDKLSRLGFEIYEKHGPVEGETEDSPEARYYIYAKRKDTKFFIVFTTESEFGQVVYSFNIASSMGDQLTEDELQVIVDDDSFDNESEEMVRQVAGEAVIEQTPIETIWQARFNLSAYASTALVNYNQREANNGFPIEFQCTRGIFPYSEGFTLRELDDRVESTIIAGNRGARYVESSLFVDKSDKDDPTEFVITANL